MQLIASVQWILRTSRRTSRISIGIAGNFPLCLADSALVNRLDPAKIIAPQKASGELAIVLTVAFPALIKQVAPSNDPLLQKPQQTGHQHSRIHPQPKRLLPLTAVLLAGDVGPAAAHR